MTQDKYTSDVPFNLCPFQGLEALQDVVLALDGSATLFPLLTELCYVLLQQLSKDQDDKMPVFSFSPLESNGSLETEYMTPHG